MSEPQTITFHLNSALMPLLEEVRRFGAMLTSEANEKFGKDKVQATLIKRLCETLTTPYGEALLLAYAGRRLLDLKGSVEFTLEGVLDRLCLRAAGTVLEAKNFELDTSKRRRTLFYVDHGTENMAIAQHAGYNPTALKRIYNEFVGANKVQQLHVFSFQPKEELVKLASGFFDSPVVVASPAQSDALDPARLFLHSIADPGRPLETHVEVNVIGH